MRKSAQITKTAGGKSYLAPWIIQHFPPRHCYLTLVDAMARSCAVAFAHDGDGKSEVVNDLDGRWTNLYKVLQKKALFAEFQRRLAVTPFSGVEYAEAEQALLGFQYDGDRHDSERVEAAANFFVLARQSHAGNLKHFAIPSTTRLRRRRNEQVSAWLTAVEDLPAVAERMLRFLILEPTDVFQLLEDWDEDRTIIYCDPPYLIHENESEARVSENFYGDFEWSYAQHVKLMDALAEVRHAYIVLSGYASKLYSERLVKQLGWHFDHVEQALHSAGGKKKRIQLEHLWFNYDPATGDKVVSLA